MRAHGGVDTPHPQTFSRELNVSRRFRAIGAGALDRLPQLARLSPVEKRALRAVSLVFPFKANAYILDELIDWDAVPDDPIYQLVFPQPGMLDPDSRGRLEGLLRDGAPREVLQAAARQIQARLNPHPGQQREQNVPSLDGVPLDGVQHKYRQTVLFFPQQSQTCHAYCAYCFRWAQFIGDPDLRFAARETAPLVRYLRAHPEVTDVLLTGGDPLVLSARLLRAYIAPLLDVPTVRSIRIGTKALAWWPHRLLSDRDSGDLLGVLEQVVASGRHLALMAHYSHPRELSTPAAEDALRRVRQTGAVVRCQSPLIRHVNDRAETWAALWQRQVQLGAVPYYLFVERDTGASRYFSVPLLEALSIYKAAWRAQSGLGRTVRGPVMSCAPGKLQLDDVIEHRGEALLTLRFLQARQPRWDGRTFLARPDPGARWISDLRPLQGERFFFQA